MPSHQIQSPVWSLRKGCWTFVPLLNSGYALGLGSAGGWREDDEDAWSGWGAGNDGREDSAGVCMVAFAWLRVSSASLRTVPGGSAGHGSAAGILSKGWWRW